MRQTLRHSWVILLSVLPVLAQPKFEVASVHQSADSPGQMRLGGPDPDKITFRNAPLLPVLTRAFGVNDYQVFGPTWLEETRYDIQATHPPGIGEVQLQLMLQDLLTERFQMAVHHEQREFTVYELTVASGGHKLPEVDRPRMSMGVNPRGDGYELKADSASLPMVARALERTLDLPVIDKTDLKGKYDFVLQFSVAEQPRGEFSFPSLSTALQELGLQIKRTKGTLDSIVVDRIEKFPTEN